MELDKFHVPNFSFCTVYHGYSITCSNGWVSSSRINMSSTTSCHQGYFRKDLFNMSSFGVKGINPEAFDIFCTFIHMYAQMMLSNEIHRKIMRQHLYIRFSMYFFQ